MNRGKFQIKGPRIDKLPENDFRRIYPNTSDIKMFFQDEIEDGHIEDIDYLVINCEPKTKEKCLPKITLTVTGKITILSGEK
jgi:hypothetical protein